MSKQIVLLFFMFLTIGVLAITINIPEDYATIQEGIDASVDGDEIIVSPGTYLENINFAGKAITLGSLFYTTQDSSYITETVINGGYDNSVVSFTSGEGLSSILTGFTITHGVSETGGGINCTGSSPTLENLRIIYNSAFGTICYGGGIYCQNSSAHLENLYIVGNIADGLINSYGGGIYCQNSDVYLENIYLADNLAEAGIGFGGGLCFQNSDAYLENLHIDDNNATSGGGIYATESSLILENISITNNTAYISGGGIYGYFFASLTLNNVQLLNNSAQYGGGLCSSLSSVILSGVTITGNTALTEGGGIKNNNNSDLTFSNENRCNLFLNNVYTREGGNDINSREPVAVIVDTFTVLNPTGFHAYPFENFTFDILNGAQEQIDSDLYISPDGNNANSGTTAEEPLQTIQYACSIIDADILNPHTIYLAEGIYCSSGSGEFFPVSLPAYVSLSGAGEFLTILDAEGASAVMSILEAGDVAVSDLSVINGSGLDGSGIFCSSSTINLMNITISNNYSEYESGGLYCGNCTITMENVTVTGNEGDEGGGISVSCSDVTMENVTMRDNFAAYHGGGLAVEGCSLFLNNSKIVGNEAWYDGGGAYLDYFFMQTSDINFENVLIENNRASDGKGGGIYTRDTNPSLAGVTIRNNFAFEGGGGIGSEYNSAPVFASENRCNIYSNNVSGRNIGCDLYTNTTMEVIVDTFTVLNPSNFHAEPRESFTFDVLAGYLEQVDADLYVSPEGNNENSGLSFEEPFQTIQHACSVIQADSTNQHTIHLASGTYSNQESGEFFPLYLPDNVSLVGESRENVILDAGGEASVIILIGAINNYISSLTITNGYGEDGGGLCCINSNPIIEDVTFTGNMARICGGALYCNDSFEPRLKNVLIANNVGHFGGGISIRTSVLMMENVTVADNMCTYLAGGIYVRDASLMMVNSIIWNNAIDQIYFNDNPPVSNATVAYSDIMYGMDGIVTNGNGTLNWLEGNMETDPLFEDAEMGNYRLTEDSPCIDNGTSYFEYEGQVLVDLSEDEYYGNAPDMGAYEYGSEYSNVTVEIICNDGISPARAYVELFEETYNLTYSGFCAEDSSVTMSILTPGNYDLTVNKAGYMPYIVDDIEITEEIILNAELVEIIAPPVNIYVEYQGEQIWLLTWDSPLIRILTNFEIYLDNELLFTVDPDIYEYEISDLTSGSHSVYLIANYTTGQSIPSEEVIFDVVSGDNINVDDLITGINLISPNPFNPETDILFELSVGGNVLLEIYNIKGQKVTTLVNKPYEAGSHKVTWNASGQSSGIYLLRFNTDEKSETKKLMLLK